jgi:drug/metabolite transporter (DMT)-like permease
MTAVFALAASLLWGLSDFGGGLLTRRFPALTVVVTSQAAVVVVLGGIVIATGGWSEAGPRLWFAAAAGVAHTVGLLCFYRALSQGPMGVVSPLAITGVAVPVVVGLALGQPAVPLQFAGMLAAVIGIMLAGGPELRGAPVQLRTIALTLAAACGFGATMALIAQASVTVTGLFLALFVQRLCSVTISGTALAVSVRRGATALPQENPTQENPTQRGLTQRGLAVLWRSLPALALVGMADVAANGTYAMAARIGSVAVAAVLASLYPVVTALAARLVLKERLLMIQAVGAVLALSGSVLVAAG